MWIRLSLLSLAIALSACFNPEEAQSDSTDTDESDGNGNETLPSAGPDGSGSGDPDSGTSNPDTDDTNGIEDPPPTVDLTVDGTTAPKPVLEAGRALLAAQADDDDGIVQVSFFRDSDLLGIDDEPPYELEIFLSSIDSGSHAYTAVAEDTGQNTTQSDPIALDVDITGGTLLAVDPELQSLGGGPVVLSAFAAFPSIHPTVTSDDELIVAATVSVNALDPNTSLAGIHLRRYDTTLADLQWETTDVDAIAGDNVSHYGHRKAYVRPNGAEVLVGGQTYTQVQGGGDTAVFRISATNGNSAPPLLVTPADGDTAGSGAMALDHSGNVVLAGPGALVTKFAPDLQTIVWQQPVGAQLIDNGVVQTLDVDSQDNVFVSIRQCVRECVLATTKVAAADGSPLWDERTAVPSGGPLNILVAGTAVGPEDQIAIAARLPDSNGFQLVIRTSLGEVASQSVYTEQPVAPTDVIYDPQGHLVITGAVVVEDEAYTAWVGRLQPDGTVDWESPLDFAGSQTVAHGVAHDARGRLYVTGAAQWVFARTLPRPGPFQLPIYEGSGWVAYLEP